MPDLKYYLDWKTTEVVLGLEIRKFSSHSLIGGRAGYPVFPNGRFTHTFRRPTHEQIFKYEAWTVLAAKEASKFRSLPRNDTATFKAAKMRFYDEIVVRTSGYRRDVPNEDKIAALDKLYDRMIYADNDLPDDDEIRIYEDINGPGSRHFKIAHIFREPTERELRKFNLDQSLKANMELYQTCLIALEGAEGSASLVDPLIQRLVVAELLEILEE